MAYTLSVLNSYLVDLYFQNIEIEESVGKSKGPKMISILGTVTRVFEQAILKAFPDMLNAPVAVTSSTQEKFGDYQCNSAMTISQVCFSDLSDFICRIQDTYICFNVLSLDVRFMCYIKRQRSLNANSVFFALIFSIQIR